MAFQEFNGTLDGEQPKSFREFNGELDAETGVLDKAKSFIEPNKSIADLAASQTENTPISAVRAGIRFDGNGLSTISDRAMDVGVDRALAKKGSEAPDSMAATSRFLQGSTSPRITDQDAVTRKPEQMMSDAAEGTIQQYGKKDAPMRKFKDVLPDTYTDLAKDFMSGMAGLSSAAGQAEKIVGLEKLGQSLVDEGDSAQKYWASLKSDYGKDAASKKFIGSGDFSSFGNAVNTLAKGDWSLGDANMTTVASQAVQSAPGMIAMGGVGKLVSAGLIKAGALDWATRLLARAGASAPVAEKAVNYIADGVAFGGSEGVFSGLQNAAQTGYEIREMSYDKLKQSPTFNHHLSEQDANLPEVERMKLARNAVADDAEMLILKRTILTTGGISAATGGGVFGVLNRGNGTRLGRVASGITNEGLLQEFPQSGIEQYWQNMGKQLADPSQDLSEGVAEQAVQGGVVGGLMGVAGGGGVDNAPEAPPVNPNAPTLTRAAQVAAQQGITPASVPSGSVSASDILGTPDVPVVDNEAPPLTRAAQVAATWVANPSSPSMSILDGVSNGATSQSDSSTLDSGSASSASDNASGSDANGVLRHDAATGAGRDVMPGTAVENDAAGGVAQNGISQPQHVGHKTEIFLPDNTELPAQWEVVDADQVSANLKEGVAQPRDRGNRAAASAQVTGIMQNFKPGLNLADTKEMSGGTSTLDNEGNVVGGNGRLEAISRLYDVGGAGDYLSKMKEFAASKGIDPTSFADMKKPVLVRRITQPFDTRALAVASNSGGSLQYSALEQAKIDGERMNGLVDIEVNDTGDVVMSAANMTNVRRALGGYNAAELGSMTDKDGLLSQEGIRRIKNALLYKTYGNSPTLSRIVESADNDLRSVSGALVRAAGSVASARSSMGNTESDIAGDLISAVEKLSQLKASGQTVEQYLAQHGLFGSEFTAEAATILRFLSDNIRSQKKMAEFIKSYYDGTASEDTKTASMFADAKPVTKQERIDHAIAKQQTATEATGTGRPSGIAGAQDQQQSQDTRSAVESSGESQQDSGVTGDGTKAAPITVEHHDHVKLAEQNVNTSPSDAQKEVGNYAKGHIVWNGLDITIENPQGSTRSGTDANGKPWEVAMPATYGYIKRTEGADGDHIDVYLGKHLQSDKVFVVDQINLKTGKFDEHKVMLGFPTLREAERIYKSGFSDGKGAARMGAVTPMSLGEFKEWTKTEDTTKPVVDSVNTGRAKAESDMQAALAEAGVLARSVAGVRNIIPEADKPKWMPVLVKMFDASLRLGYYEAKDASRYVREQLSTLGKGLGKFMSKAWLDEAFKNAAARMPEGFFENQGLFGQKQEPIKEAEHVQDRMTNADKRRNPDRFNVPALHNFVPSDVLKRAHDLIATLKHKKPKPVAHPAADVAIAEKAIKPLLEMAEKNLSSFKELIVDIAHESGIGQIVGGVKAMDRCVAKLLTAGESQYATRDLLGNVIAVHAAEQLRDTLRATIVINSYDDVQAVMSAIEKRFKIESGRIKNKVAKPNADGYRDVMLNVILPDGLKAEIQINTPAMLSAKELGHELYNFSRIDGVSEEIKAEADDMQRAIYLPAYAHSVASATASMNLSSDIGKENLPGSGDATTSLPNTLNTEPSDNLKNGVNSVSTSKNLVPSGNLTGNSETGNLSGNFISGSSKHTIAKNTSEVHNEGAGSGENTTQGAQHDNRATGAGSTQGQVTQTDGGTAIQRKSGSVHTGSLGRNILANELPGTSDSGKAGNERGARDAEGGDIQLSPAPRKGDRAGRAVGVPAGRDIPAKSGLNYHFTDTDLDYKGSWIAKAGQNVEAVELVKKLDAEGRKATRAEQAILAKFIGWGASDIRNNIFDNKLDEQLETLSKYDEAIANLGNKPYLTNSNYREYHPAFLVLQAKNPALSWYTAGNITKAMLDAAKPDSSWSKWGELRDRLKSVMTDEEWATAERSTQYAHFTGKEVVNEMWRAVDRLGFKGGSMLEPGAGNGVFPGLMPSAMANNSIYTGIEYDALTGAILKHLQPDERILVESYIDSALPDNFYDVAIGNPPFSDTKVLSDPRYKKHAFALHDYFFAKTLDKVKPGGLLMFVTSRHTMDKQGDKARQYLAERADLLGAIRLPETAFKKNAGTEVVTDILFLRKKVDGETFAGHDWMKLDKIKVKGGDHLINEYFSKHPEMVLGEGALESGQFGKQYTVLPNKSAPITELLAKAVDNLPRDVYRTEAGSAAQSAQVREIDWNPKAKKEGNYYVSDKGNLMQVENRAGVPAKVNLKNLPMVKDFVKLRDAINQAQYDQLNNGDWESSLKALQKQYKAFVKAHGNILQNTVTERTNTEIDEDTGEKIEVITPSRRFDLLNKLTDDPEYSKLYALESLNEDTGEIKEGEFLTKRVLEMRKVAQISTPHDALLSVLNDTGSVNIPLIAERIGLSDREVTEALGSSIYESPNGQWAMQDEYLSGNVKKKLKEAQEAAKTDRRFERNVEALMSAQPAPVSPADITTSLGMNWIPGETYAKFLLEKAGVKATVDYNEHTGQWRVNAISGYGSVQATSDWGTPQRNAADILEAGLTGRPIRITKTEGSGKDKKTLFDANATEAANQKLKEMRQAFKSWMWQDSERTDKLVALYNDKFNTIVARKFDGRHLTLPGTTSTISVFDHVKRGAWRVIQSGNTYLAHAVGSGKTWEMVISAMEQKRLGLINKPMMVVPNHMLQQFAQEWLQLYPAARLMVADEKQFHTDNRRRFISRVSMSDLDGVIITHSAFKLLDLDPEFKQKMIQEQLDQMEAAMEGILDEEGIDDAKKSRNPRVRDIQSRIEKLDEKLKAAMSGEGKDKNVRFDEMGVDFLYVDEAHEFRKLAFTTSRQVKGISSNGSERAFDLYMKTRWLEQKKPGRSLVMASGTPITNTIAEIYSVQRFMAPQVLEERGLQDFDAWASMFGEEHTAIESDASGKYAPVTRFSRFVNVPELTQMFREFADVLTSDHLAEMLGDKRPKLKEGNRRLIITPQINDYRSYKEELARRLEISRKWKPSRDEPNNPDPVIRIIGDGRLAAIDMRFINPSLPSDPHSKLNQMIDGVIRSYKKYSDYEYNDKSGKKEDAKGATQMVFSDLGFGAGVAESRGFNARAWMEKRLRDAGIPINKVAFMSDYKKSDAKQKLFKDMNTGRVRILVGSSKNMGTGVNAQQRLRSLHHLDTPWYPSDLEQREGRIIRQGNKNRNLRIYAYSTKDSYDSVMWQMLASKQRFIDQALSGDSSIRTLDDISEVSQFEMATALTAGYPRAVQLAGLKADIEKYQRLYRAHEENRMRMKESYMLAGNTIKVSERNLPEAEKLAAKVQDLSGDRFTAKAGKQAFDSRKEWGEALLSKLKSYTDTAKEGRETVGELSGFPVEIIGTIDRNNDGKVLGYYVRLEMKLGESAAILARDPIEDTVGMAIRATNALSAIARKPEELRQAIADAKSKRNALEGRLDSPFQFAQELSDKIKESADLEDAMVADDKKDKSESELVQKAKVFADKHHGEIDQRRKFTNDPYITHPAGVVEILKTVPHTEEMLAAAWAHDTVEDTKATIEDVRRELGDKVGDLVAELTDVKRDGTRAERDAAKLDHSAKTSAAAQTIKLADIINNLSGIAQADKDFAKRYQAEKAAQIEVLTKGDATLLAMARDAVTGDNTPLSSMAPRTSHAGKKSEGMTSERVAMATANLRAAWRGFQRIHVVQSVADIPNDLYLRALRALKPIDKGTEGLYDPITRSVYLIADNISTPERAVWVAAHEVVGHGGIRMLGGMVSDALNHAAKNGFVTKLARSIADDRGEAFDTKTHIDEAIAELAAATITGKVDSILNRYGVKVPVGMRSNLLGMIKRVIDAVRNFVAKALRKSVSEVGDGEIQGLLKRMNEVVDGKDLPIDSSDGDALLSSRAPAQQSQEQPRILRMAKKSSMEKDVSLVDKVVSAPFKLVGWNRIVEPALDRLMERMGEFVPEKVKAGMISDYGLSGEYIDRKAEMKASEAAQNRKSAGLVEMLAALTRAESRIAYQWMQEKPDTATEQALLENLPAESRETLERLKKMISDLGKEAVRMGQMSNEAYQRNNMAYLHRTYAKHVLDNEGAIGKMLRARALKIKGNQYKGRGIFDEVRMDDVGGDPMFWRKLQQGRADNSLVGSKLIRFERRDDSTDAMDALPGMTSKPMGKLREVIYWPSSQTVPARFGDWVNSGTFEVRDTKSDKLVVWRDFTPEERQRMGELDEVRYAVAQTLQMMAHDIEVGRFFEWTAKQYGKIKPDGKETTASESMLHSYGKDEWVQVPSTNIPNTQTRKYGALSGLYVPGAVWNDIRQTSGTRIEPFGHIHEKVLQFWKKSKTAWSPAVHMNNVMANFVMADWHDLRATDMAEALKVWANNNKDGYREIYQRFEDSGALGGMFLSNEALRDEIAKQLESIKKELTGEQDANNEMTRMAKVMHLVTMAGMVPAKGATAYASGMESAYQFEDAIFRLAAFTKAIRYGKSDIEAGRIARHAFLNYDINAPWIQALRHTFLPFVSFFYRALPMAVNTVKTKPWKVVKLMAFYSIISALGSMGAGGDDDEERKLLPKEKQGRVWGVVPKMVRMPWNHDDGAPYYLDIRRWVPVGDIADMEMGSGMLPPWATPGGVLPLLAEVLLMNKSIFTEKEIVQDTDTQSEKLEKRLDHLFKGMLPNVPLPNPLNVQLPTGEINPLKLDQGSLQPYAWSGIERSALKREGSIGEVRTTPAAIASAFGVKVSAYPAQNMMASKQIEVRKQVEGIKDSINKIARNYGNLEKPTNAEQARFERDIDRQRGKLQELQDGR